MTRVSLILPNVPGLGVWRLDTSGYNAAVELPGTLDLLSMAAQGQRFIPAVLRLEQRTAKRPGPNGQPQTRRFVVPVLDVKGTTGQLMGGPRMALPDLAGRDQITTAPAALLPSSVSPNVSRTIDFGPEPELPHEDEPSGSDSSPVEAAAGLSPLTVAEFQSKAAAEELQPRYIQQVIKATWPKKRFVSDLTDTERATLWDSITADLPAKAASIFGETA